MVYATLWLVMNPFVLITMESLQSDLAKVYSYSLTNDELKILISDTKDLLNSSHNKDNSNDFCAN